MAKQSKAYEIAVTQYNTFMRDSRTMKISVEQTFDFSYEKLSTGLQKRSIAEDFTVLTKGFINELNLSTRAKLMILDIMEELKLNNPLWYFDHTKNTRDAATIKELRDKNILFKLEDPRIHYVNPQYIKRGTRASVLCAIQNELEGVVRVGPENIRNLTKLLKIDLNQFDITTSSNQIIKL
jgi:hypothetical protein